MHLVEMIRRPDAFVMLPERLPQFRRKLQSAAGLRRIESDVQEYLALDAKQHPVLAIRLILGRPRQGERKLTYLFDVHRVYLMSFLNLAPVS